VGRADGSLAEHRDANQHTVVVSPFDLGPAATSSAWTSLRLEAIVVGAAAGMNRCC
jgi:hypothetical protein